jgi:glycosyltransferase involved in cell wall biosynthesis
MGGGEQLAAAYALSLNTRFDVDLIATSQFDLELLSRRLGKPQLKTLGMRTIGDSPTAATEISAEYDLFVNHSFTSEDVNLSKRGIYVCMFPQEFRGPISGNLRNRLSCRSSGSVSVSQPGDYFVVGAESSLHFSADSRETLTFILQDSAGLVELRDAKGLLISQNTVGEKQRELITLSLPEGASELRVTPFVHTMKILSPRLGDGTRLYVECTDSIDRAVPAFLSSYDVVLSISRFTQAHVDERWHCSSSVHYPPVDLRQPSAFKQDVILSVGRFFSEDHGHCKQQLRMVRAFRRMVDQGLEGWRLSLVGGCDKEHRNYALAVRQAAHGYPIDVFLNADLEKLDHEFARAKIYWLATGLGTDINSQPEKAEHFGIAPIEAMSTGAIPIVLSFGGPAETILDGECGFTFDDENSLIERTLEVIAMSSKRMDEASQAAIRRAQDFAVDRFDDELTRFIG